MKKFIFFLISFIYITGFITFCDSSDQKTGRLKINIADTAVDGTDIEGVYITIKDVEYHTTGGWGSVGLLSPRTYNLLELTGGNYALLSSFNLPSGKITQLRFILDITEEDGIAPIEPKSYVLKTGNVKYPIFVPSNDEYIGVGNFEVPVNATLEITADFDVRKGLVLSGGTYKLKPTIRLIVNNQAGDIKGTITNGSLYTRITVLVYEDGSYKAGEATIGTDGSQFTGAVAGSSMDAGGAYKIALLAPGTYDLIVIGNNNDGSFGAVLGKLAGVTVSSKETTTQNIDTTALSTP